MARYEWDNRKSDENKKKHGVSFDDAVLIWQGVYLTVNQIAHAVQGETRNATVGLIRDKVYTAIWTEREGVIRFISVRRARDGEEKIYWQRISEQL